MQYLVGLPLKDFTFWYQYFEVEDKDVSFWIKERMHFHIFTRKRVTLLLAWWKHKGTSVMQHPNHSYYNKSVTNAVCQNRKKSKNI